MFYKTIRGRKSPITFRNTINFVVRWWELFGLKSASRHYEGGRLELRQTMDAPRRLCLSIRPSAISISHFHRSRRAGRDLRIREFELIDLAREYAVYHHLQRRE